MNRDYVVSIDLGSSFTKVALRRTPRDPSRLVNKPDGIPVLGEFIVPSLVAAIGPTSTEGKMAFAFGDQAFDLRPSNERLKVHEDWKRKLFFPPTAEVQPQRGWDALLASEEMANLVQAYGIPAQELEHLKRLLEHARGFAGLPALQDVKRSRTHSPQEVAYAVAVKFLTWLRSLVLQSLAVNFPNLAEPEQIPVRVAVPAFAPEDQLAELPGCKLLAQALAKSGWTLHPERGFVSEPQAKIIGILSEGRNVLHRVLYGKRWAERETIHLKEIFGKSPLIQTMADSRKPDENSNPLAVYRVFVVDLGAFTTDFGLLELDPNQEKIVDAENDMAVRTHSVALGVSDLDARVKACYTPEQREYLKTMTSAGHEEIRIQIYTEQKPYRLADGTSLGGPAQRPAIDNAIKTFADKLAAEALQFFGEPRTLQTVQLIFTGGGMNIEAIRSAVQDRLAGVGHKFHSIYFPTDKKENLPRRGTRPAMVRLSEQLARGGTALGGASIVFDKCFY